MKKILATLLTVIIAFSCLNCVIASAVAEDINAGTSMSNAVNIPSFTKTYAQSITKSGEEDWFKFTTLSSQAYYYFTFRNNNVGSNYSNIRLQLFLYDKNMNQKLNLSAAENESVKNDIFLEKNTTYYIKVMHNSFKSVGYYEIGIQYKLDEVPNSIDNSVNLTVNSFKPFVSSIDGNGDEDWYKFTSATTNSTFTVTLRNNNVVSNYSNIGLQLFLYDKNMNQKLKFDPIYENDSKTGNITLEKNTTYYIKVKHGSFKSAGTYELSVSTTGSVPSTKTLSSITMKNMPSKTTYTVGDSFSSLGASVTAKYSDGSTETISASNLSFSGFSSSSAGTKTVTVKYTYGGVTKSCTFSVTVVATTKTLSSITMKNMPSKTTYTVGDSFSSSGASVTAKYSDGSTETIGASNLSFSGFSSSSAGTKTVTVKYTYNGVTKSTSFDVKVNEKSEPEEEEDVTFGDVVIFIITLPFRLVYYILCWPIIILK